MSMICRMLEMFWLVLKLTFVNCWSVQKLYWIMKLCIHVVEMYNVPFYAICCIGLWTWFRHILIWYWFWPWGLWIVLFRSYEGHRERRFGGVRICLGLGYPTSCRDLIIYTVLARLNPKGGGFGFGLDILFKSSTWTRFVANAGVESTLKKFAYNTPGAPVIGRGRPLPGHFRLAALWF